MGDRIAYFISLIDWAWARKALGPVPSWHQGQKISPRCNKVRTRV
jgi:hypothetical protein